MNIRFLIGQKIPAKPTYPGIDDTTSPKLHTLCDKHLGFPSHSCLLVGMADCHGHGEAKAHSRRPGGFSPVADSWVILGFIILMDTGYRFGWELSKPKPMDMARCKRLGLGFFGRLQLVHLQE